MARISNSGANSICQRNEISPMDFIELPLPSCTYSL
jgi:hypothetical protein